jgi:ubiquinone/menaquinone biosynthesis C-methylase UbiE
MGERYEVEKVFHDRKAQAVQKDFLYSCGILLKPDSYAYKLLEPLEGKVVLDLGCGSGHHSVVFAKRGAYVYAIDLSPEMVRKAREFAEKEGVADRITILEMNAEALEFPNETFDIVFGHSILHHLDLEAARVGIYRVLKRGGKGIFLEPLGHNVFINIFRKITPHRRTPTEKPLLMEDILFFAEPFSSVCHREFFFLALCALPLLALPRKKLFEKTFSCLSKLDELLLAWCPNLGRWAWVTVVEVVK